jgi:hypothetical protein
MTNIEQKKIIFKKIRKSLSDKFKIRYFIEKYNNKNLVKYKELIKILKLLKEEDKTM